MSSATQTKNNNANTPLHFIRNDIQRLTSMLLSPVDQDTQNYIHKHLKIIDQKIDAEINTILQLTDKCNVALTTAYKSNQKLQTELSEVKKSKQDLEAKSLEVQKSEKLLQSEFLSFQNATDIETDDYLDRITKKDEKLEKYRIQFHKDLDTKEFFKKEVENLKNTIKQNSQKLESTAKQDAKAISRLQDEIQNLLVENEKEHERYLDAEQANDKLKGEIKKLKTEGQRNYGAINQIPSSQKKNTTEHAGTWYYVSKRFPYHPYHQFTTLGEALSAIENTLGTPLRRISLSQSQEFETAQLLVPPDARATIFEQLKRFGVKFRRWLGEVQNRGGQREIKKIFKKRLRIKKELNDKEILGLKSKIAQNLLDRKKIAIEKIQDYKSFGHVIFVIVFRTQDQKTTNFIYNLRLNDIIPEDSMRLYSVKWWKAKPKKFNGPPFRTKFNQKSPGNVKTASNLHHVNSYNCNLSIDWKTGLFKNVPPAGSLTETKYFLDAGRQNEGTINTKTEAQHTLQ